MSYTDAASYMRPDERARQGAYALDRAYGVWAHLVDGAALSFPADLLVQLAAAFAWPDTSEDELQARTLAALGLRFDYELTYHGLTPLDEAETEALLDAWRALIAQRTPAGWWA